MTNFKTFTLAAAAALSLGVGSAMAQDSAFFQEQDQALGGFSTHHVAPLTMQPQAGSSDVERSHGQWYYPVPQGADGNG